MRSWIVHHQPGTDPVVLEKLLEQLIAHPAVARVELFDLPVETSSEELRRRAAELPARARAAGQTSLDDEPWWDR